MIVDNSKPGQRWEVYVGSAGDGGSELYETFATKEEADAFYEKAVAEVGWANADIQLNDLEEQTTVRQFMPQKEI